MTAPKDYASLRRKLAQGKLLAQAAAEAGMSEEDAKAYLDGRASEEDQSLRAFSDQALKVALNALTRAVKEKNRGIMTKDVSDDGDGGRLTVEKREAVIDVDAAKALLKAGLDARKMLKSAAAKASSRDLFDGAAAADDGPWAFKKRD